MDEVQKQGLKDLLHLLVDKEELPVLQDLIAKLPAKYSVIGAGILSQGGGALVKAEDSLIDSKLK